MSAVYQALSFFFSLCMCISYNICGNLVLFSPSEKVQGDQISYQVTERVSCASRFQISYLTFNPICSLSFGVIIFLKIHCQTKPNSIAYKIKQKHFLPPFTAFIHTDSFLAGLELLSSSLFLCECYNSILMCFSSFPSSSVARANHIR